MKPDEAKRVDDKASLDDALTWGGAGVRRWS